MRKVKTNNSLLSGLSLVVVMALAISCSKKGSSENKVPPGPPPADATHIYIQDSAFNAYLKAKICPDAFDKDGRLDITHSEVTGFTGKMVIDSASKIRSLKGITYFTSMKKLSIQGSAVDTLDLSTTMSIDTLRVQNNLELQLINVKGCTSMQYIRFENNPVKTMDLSNLPALNMISGLASSRLSTLKVDNDGNLQHIICIGLTSLTTVNTASCPNLQRLYLDYCYAVSSLNVTNNPKLKGLIVTNAGSFKTVDLSGNPLLAFAQFDESGVDSLDFSHNPELFSVSSTYTRLRYLSFLNSPKLACIALDGCSYLKAIDLRAQTHDDFWYAPASAISKMSVADAYELYPDGFAYPVQTSLYTTHGTSSRKIEGAIADIFGGIRIPQYLDASGLSLASIKVNDAIKNNYSFVMARRTGNIVPPPVVTVYAADKTTILCNDYRPETETCNQ